MSIRIKKITAPETHELRHQVMWPNKPKEFVRLPNDEKGLHLGLLKKTELVCVVSLFITGNRAQFRKFATKTSEQGNGYGTLLLKHLMTITRDQKIETIWCNARVDKAPFYERFGMTQTPKKFMRAGIHYVLMEKTFEKKV